MKSAIVISSNNIKLKLKYSTHISNSLKKEKKLFLKNKEGFHKRDSFFLLKKYINILNVFWFNELYMI
jgi:hypothetical protein